MTRPPPPPPSPNGTVPPLPAGAPNAHPTSTPYANYGYGSAAAVRPLPAPQGFGGNASGSVDTQQQAQWQQQWSQYYAQQSTPTSAVQPSQPYAGTYHPQRPAPGAGRPAIGPQQPQANNTLYGNHSQTYSPGQPHSQPVHVYAQHGSPSQPTSASANYGAYGYVATPSQPDASALQYGGYNPTTPQVTGSQIGPAAKKPRYNPPSMPASAPLALNTAVGAGAMPRFSAPSAVAARPKTWQGASQMQPSQPQPQPQPQPRPSMPQHQRPPSGPMSAPPGLPPTPMGAARPLNRNRNGPSPSLAAPMSGSMRKASASQRGNMSVASNGPSVGPVRGGAGGGRTPSHANAVPAWGPRSLQRPGSAAEAGGTGLTVQLAQRRSSSTGSSHGDKKSAVAPENRGGTTQKAGFSSQNMIPIAASRGSNVFRNSALDKSTVPKAPLAPKELAATSARVKTTVAATESVGRTRNNNRTLAGGRSTGAVGLNGSRDMTDGLAAPSSKRFHTDFRIRGVEIKELGWSWHAPDLDSDGDEDEDGKNSDSDIDDDPTGPIDRADEVEDTFIPDSTDPTHFIADVEPPETENGSLADAAGSIDSSILPLAAEPASMLPSDATPVSSSAALTHGGNGAPVDADVDVDTAMSEVKLQTGDGTPGDRQTSARAQGPPVVEPPRGPKADSIATSEGARSSAMRARIAAHLRESTRLRICFAAMPNAGPDGAPAGPKAEERQTEAPASDTVPAGAADSMSATASTGRKRAAVDGAEHLLEEAHWDEASQPKRESDSNHDGFSVQEDAAQHSNAAVESSESEAKAHVLAAVEQSAVVDSGTDTLDPSSDATEPSRVPPSGDDVSAPTAILEGSDYSESKPEDLVTAKLEEGGPNTSGSGPAGREEQPGDQSNNDGNNAEPSDAGHEKSMESKQCGKTGSPEGTIPAAKGPPPMSLNRIFVSYAGTRKRIAIEADVVKSVTVCRAECRIEIVVDLAAKAAASKRKGDEYLVAKGRSLTALCHRIASHIPALQLRHTRKQLEVRDKGQENYVAVSGKDVERSWIAAETEQQTNTGSNARINVLNSAEDEKKPSSASAAVVHNCSELPPFFRLAAGSVPSSTMTIVAMLDSVSPLVEPKWVKKGDVGELLAGLEHGGHAAQSSVHAKDAAARHVWAGKIRVVDPDPAPSIESVYDDWVRDSFIGSYKERRQFIDDFLSYRGDATAPTPSSSVKPDGEGGASTESDAKRDGRIARGMIEMLTRLVKGERAALDPGTRLGAALSTGTLTRSTTFVGATLIALLNLALDACSSSVSAPTDARADSSGSTSQTDAKGVRAWVSSLLMEYQPSLLHKALDLTYKDAVEEARRAAAGTGAAAAVGTVSTNDAAAKAASGAGAVTVKQNRHSGRHHSHVHAHKRKRK
ncbi:hypothetical protein BCV70DRAFT_230192 [Testicularia cyperi]|uniref:Uncharacterized protein n=1 Tax=Testicularia cyperi TaxID=1882483 RepID=A0A317XXC6_9BASI|nr:hypothetical protein BCV70DRAFT_230192 [Testicularia cyperi]